MLRGIALRALDHEPMVRQCRGVMDIYIEDVTRYVKDYNANCIVWPMHPGHKDQVATLAFMRDLCRDLDVPMVPLGCDVWDKRYMSIEAIKEKLARFFDVHDF